MGKGVLSWLKPVLKTKEPDLVDRIGLDATVFLRFTKMLRNIFLFLSIIGCTVMIPVNLTESSKEGTSNYSKFTLMTPLYVSSMAIWSQVVMAWAFDAIVAYFLWRNYVGVRALRRRYFESSEYQHSLHARTLIVCTTSHVDQPVDIYSTFFFRSPIFLNLFDQMRVYCV